MGRDLSRRQFPAAKKGALPSVKPSGARERSGWYWLTIKVFRWKYGWKVPLRVKLSLRREAQDGQQLRLRVLVFAKRRAIPRHVGLSYLQCHLPESHQTHFGHKQQRVSPELVAA